MTNWLNKMSPWTKVIIFGFAAFIVSFSIRRLLKGRIDDSLIEGFTFWLLFVILYPAVTAWSRYSGKPDSTQRNGFLIYLFGTTLATATVIILAKAFS